MDMPNVRFQVTLGERARNKGSSARFGPLMRGTGGGVRPIPVVGSCSMPQPILRHIARRAVQVVIAAAGILAVLLVFSRQAHAATLAPSAAPTPSVSSAPSASSAPAVPAPSAPATSAPATSAPAPSAPAPSAPAPSAPAPSVPAPA